MSDAPHLGGLTAIALFVAILVAFVVQSAITQVCRIVIWFDITLIRCIKHVQVSLGFRQPFFLL